MGHDLLIFDDRCPINSQQNQNSLEA